MSILGIDPGVQETGWAFIEGEAARPNLKASGVIRTSAPAPLPARLKIIYSDLSSILREFRPDSCAVEEMFFTTIAHTVRATLQARGVTLLAIAQADCPVYEYNPRTVKLSITGSGQATKINMQDAVQKNFRLAERLRPHDVADAAAIALCHLRASRMNRLKILDSWGKA